ATYSPSPLDRIRAKGHHAQPCRRAIIASAGAEQTSFNGIQGLRNSPRERHPQLARGRPLTKRTRAHLSPEGGDHRPGSAARDRFEFLPQQLSGAIRSPARGFRASRPCSRSHSMTNQTTMRALVKRERKLGLWMEEVPVPEVGPQDVLIHVRRSAI